jgi:hypothetical protein
MMKSSSPYKKLSMDKQFKGIFKKRMGFNHAKRPNAARTLAHLYKVASQ